MLFMVIKFNDFFKRCLFGKGENKYWKKNLNNVS